MPEISLSAVLKLLLLEGAQRKPIPSPGLKRELKRYTKLVGVQYIDYTESGKNHGMGFVTPL